MKKYILIGVGGTIGAIIRFLFERIQIYQFTNHFPLNTLLINISGTFILSFLLTMAFKIKKFDTYVRMGVCTGFLGAFTTFSTLCKETVGLISERLYFSAISYILISIVVGFLVTYLGAALALKFNLKLFISCIK